MAGASDLEVVVVLLAVGQLVTLALCVLLWWRLRRARHRAEAVTEALEAELAPRRVDQARTAAEWAVRTVVDTAVKVRERGVGGMLSSSIDDFTRWVLEDRAEIDLVAGPDGQVTLLFSDIEDSTAHNERLGDDHWVRVLAEHDRVVRAQVTRHHGHIVKSQGDGFMVVFPTPTDGVAAALDIQQALRQHSRRLRRTPVRVRMGLHTGTVVSRDGDYFGRNVAMAARVAAQADGGTVLVTDAVRERLPDEAGAGAFEVTPDREVPLKGLTGHHVLWRVTR